VSFGLFQLNSLSRHPASACSDALLRILMKNFELLVGRNYPGKREHAWYALAGFGSTSLYC